MQGVPFASYRKDFLSLKSSEQELMSAMYAVHPVPVDDPEHYIVLYADMQNGGIGFNILDAQNMDLRLLAQVPHSVIIQLGKLLEQVKKWFEGEAPYPHSQHMLPPAASMDTSDIGEDRLSELQSREDAAMELIERATKKK